MFGSKAVSSTRIISTFKTPFPNLGFSYRRNCHESSDKNQKGGDIKSEEEHKFPEEPTTCCMSGCANCVWLEYVEQITQLCQDQGEEALKIINEKVTDPNIKAFLLSELRMKNS